MATETTTIHDHGILKPGVLQSEFVTVAVLWLSWALVLKDITHRRHFKLARSGMPAGGPLLQWAVAVFGFVHVHWLGTRQCQHIVLCDHSFRDGPRPFNFCRHRFTFAIGTLIGGFIGPALAGWSADHWGLQSSLLIDAGCAFAMAIVSLGLRETKASGARSGSSIVA